MLNAEKCFIEKPSMLFFLVVGEFCLLSRWTWPWSSASLVAMLLVAWRGSVGSAAKLLPSARFSLRSQDQSEIAGVQSVDTRSFPLFNTLC